MTSKCPFLQKMEEQIRLAEARYANAEGDVYADAADPLTVARSVIDQDGDMPNSAGLSTLFTTWGQFLDHDLVFTPEAEDAGLLDIPGMDREVHRSLKGLGEDGKPAPLNAVTWQLDGSAVYGSTADRASLLREFDGGRLLVSDDATSARDLLPQAHEDAPMAGDISGDDPVYLAGDIRANENPNLLSMHTLFVREHNYWAERLAEENPDWSDEDLYEAARSVVEYEMQKITYEEWLPHLIGDATGPDTGYNPDAVGQMSVEFSTAAFRLGHTLVSDGIDMLDDTGADSGSLALMDAFFNHETVQENGIDSLLRGQLASRAQEMDAKVVDSLNFALQNADGTGGFSLPALNIARGLDHGLSSYVDTRAALLGDIDPDTLDPTDFSVITSDPDLQAAMAQAFGTVDQVDLWTGGLSEEVIDGTQLGPLFTHIVAEQFARTRAADETFGQLDPRLGPEIISEVQSTNFATIIERNTDIDMIQDDVFLAEDRSLSVVDLSDGTQEDDAIVLTAARAEGNVSGMRGDDTLALIGGTQLDGDVRGGSGNDVIVQSSGDVTGDIAGGTGADKIGLSGTAVVGGNVKGGAGNDSIALTDISTIENDLKGQSGDDLIMLEGKADIGGAVHGGSGDDTITLGDEVSVTGQVRGGRGDDVFAVEQGAGAQSINGGTGDDTLAITGHYRVEPGSNEGDGTVIFLNSDGSETGDTLDFSSIEKIACFTPGTALITAQGKRSIESLQVGDLVWTLNRGLQPIRWIGTSTVSAQGELAPILIEQGALGNARAMLVSPQHRMLIQDWRVELFFGTPDPILVPAKGLLNGTTIRRAEGGHVTYMHLAFDQHEIVFADGIPSESLLVGPGSLDTLPEASARELSAIFPEIRAGDAFDLVSPAITVRDAQAIFSRGP